MQKKLGEWKKQGFDIGGIIEKKGIAKKNVKKEISKLKKKGFDAHVLGK